MLQLKWILNNVDIVKNTVVAVLSDETAEDMENMKSIIEKGVIIAFDLLREPLKELGIDVDRTRTLPSQEAEKVKAQLLNLQNKD